MKKKILAFYDVINIAVLTVILIAVAIKIITSGIFNSWENMVYYWYLIVIFSFCLALPIGSLFWLQRVTIDLNSDYADFYYLVNYRRNDQDIHVNWRFYPSEVVNVRVVKLTKAEKKQYTSARFLFSKYLEVEMKYGHKKYVYIAHYSNRQIRKIAELLLYNKNKEKLTTNDKGTREN